MSVSHGAVRAAADVLRLPGQIPHPQAAAMPALLLHGALHGGPIRIHLFKCDITLPIKAILNSSVFKGLTGYLNLINISMKLFCLHI